MFYLKTNTIQFWFGIYVAYYIQHITYILLQQDDRQHLAHDRNEYTDDPDAHLYDLPQDRYPEYYKDPQYTPDQNYEDVNIFNFCLQPESDKFTADTYGWKKIFLLCFCSYSTS